MKPILVNGVEYRTYAFEYGHDHARWELEIVARSPEDAQARIKALAFAQYKGELVAKIYIPITTSWLAHLRSITRTMFKF